MADTEPDNHSGQSGQQLRYYQMRGEKWLFKLKLIILAVLCVLLGAFLIAFEIQAHIQDFVEKDDCLLSEHKDTLKKCSESENRVQQLQAEKDKHTKDLQERERTVQQLQAEKHKLTKDLQDKEKKIQQLQTEKEEQTCDPQSLCVDKSCCAEGWKYFRGKCYYFSTDEKTWTASRDACVAAGGDLVIISSTEEQDFIKRSNPGVGEQRYWVGLTDAVEEGVWRWLDGTRLSQTPKYWTGNEPDNWKGENSQYPEGEDCAVICLDSDFYGFLDGFCDVEEKKRVCEAKAPK